MQLCDTVRFRCADGARLHLLVRVRPVQPAHLHHRRFLSPYRQGHLSCHPFQNWYKTSLLRRCSPLPQCHILDSGLRADWPCLQEPHLPRITAGDIRAVPNDRLQLPLFLVQRAILAPDAHVRHAAILELLPYLADYNQCADIYRGQRPYHHLWPLLRDHDPREGNAIAQNLQQ